MRCGTSFISNLLFFMRCVDFLDAARTLHEHSQFYQCHQVPLLCDRQELASTPKDPPRRVEMEEMSLIVLQENASSCDKTVRKPTLGEPFENRICVFIS